MDYLITLFIQVKNSKLVVRFQRQQQTMRVQILQIRKQMLTILQYLTTRTYTTGVNVRGMRSTAVRKLVKVLVHIGGTRITGMMQQYAMVM